MIRTPLSFRVNIFRRGYSDLLKDKEPLSTPDIGHSPAMDELGEALQKAKLVERVGCCGCGDLGSMSGGNNVLDAVT